MINQFLAVALGGALGASARFALTLLSQHFFSHIIGLATIFVNIVGCLIMGLAFVFFDLKYPEAATLTRQFVMIGFLGAFTTYSSFSLDAFKLLQQGQMLNWCVYVFATLIFSLLATLLGIWAGKTIFNL